ncbi:hypothetical protein GOP47_0026375 [Adiantum capillus-veneris]|nr:hypothetical protein GOP47_0026375 [Adiantum capillus-veneris]
MEPFDEQTPRKLNSSKDEVLGQPKISFIIEFGDGRKTRILQSGPGASVNFVRLRLSIKRKGGVSCTPHALLYDLQSRYNSPNSAHVLCLLLCQRRTHRHNNLAQVLTAPTRKASSLSVLHIVSCED